MTDYTRLRQLAENATPGPWVAEIETYSSEGGDFIGGHIPGVAEVVSDYYIGDVPPFTHDDAEFIAAANPDTILRLLDELRTAKAEAWDEAWKAAGEYGTQVWDWDHGWSGSDDPPPAPTNPYRENR